MESETDKSFSQSTLQQTSMKRLKTNDVAIAQREREIEDIAQGIIELADIFKDLQGMVIDQGTMLDRIDYNIENMSVNVKAADKELNVVCLSLFRDIACCADLVFEGDWLSEEVHQAEDPVFAISSRRRHVYPSPRQA